MTEIRRCYMLLLTLVLVACGDAGDGAGDEAPGPASAPLLTAATLGEQQVLANSAYLAQPPYADADPSRGERQALMCRACHSLESGGRNMLGPALHGFFGREVGAVEGFDYSSAIREADFVWTPRALDAWLREPARFLPGNRMIFAGVPDAGDREALIAYLLEVTAE